MRPACKDFAEQYLPPLEGCRVVEVGSLYVNDSIRSVIEAKGCGEYVGVDIVLGGGVDIVGDACELSSLVGEESAGLVISIDTLEHILDWRRAVSEMKRTCAPRGMILVTAAPVGFRRHDYPTELLAFYGRPVSAHVRRLRTHGY